MKNTDQIAEATRAYDVLLTLCRSAVQHARNDASRAALVWFIANRERMIQSCPDGQGEAMTWMLDRVVYFHEDRAQ